MSYWSIAVDKLADTAVLARDDYDYLDRMPGVGTRPLKLDVIQQNRPTLYWRMQTYLETFAEDMPKMQDWLVFQVTNYPNLKPYYWSPDMTEAMIRSSRSVPVNVPMNLSWFPTDGFFWHLEHTAKTPSTRPSTWDPTLREHGYHDLRIDAIVGVPVRSDKGNFLYCELLTSGYTNGGGLVPFLVTSWQEGQTVDEFVRATVGRAAGFAGMLKSGGAEQDEIKDLAVVRFENAYLLGRELMAGGLWLNQRIMVTADAPVERHVRKRAAKTLNQPSDRVRVVHLRRTERLKPCGKPDVPADRPQSVGDDGTRDWAFQWVVRGHWRHQYYRSLDTHRVIWIDPYVKGPEDKPLKPSATVFAVIR